MSPFIDAATRAKIAFVKGEEALADLQKVIPPEVCLNELREMFKDVKTIATLSQVREGRTCAGRPA